MARIRIPLLLNLFLYSVLLLGRASPASAAHVDVIELDNQIISPVTQQYLTTAIDRAEADGAECLVIVLDTPGGLLESTRGIVKRMMNARVPIVVYVGPSGARAGSAGVFITLAAHVAAMAPSTNIGAAHPVIVGEGGGPVKKLIRKIRRAADQDPRDGKPSSRRHQEEEIVEEEEQDPMSQKIINDTVAWVTTIARTRHRNEDWAKHAVTESFSITEEEAVRDHIVDLTAKDLGELLTRLDGRSIETADGSHTLATASAEVRRVAMTSREQFLAVITNPNIAYLLMLLGTLGLVFEFTHPGAGFPGIAGAICLILAMYALQTLPVNYAALALLGLGLGLLVAEVKVAGFGLLGIGGAVSLTLGSLLLFHSPEGFGVSLAVIIPVVLGMSAIILFLVSLAVRAHRQPVTTGAAGMVGQRGTAETDLSPTGTIFIRGELWSAVADEPVRKGESVTIVRMDGLTLYVTRDPSPRRTS